MTAPILAQKQMRLRLRQALRTGLVGVVDIGSSKIACMVAKVDYNRIARAVQEGRVEDGFAAIRVLGAGVTRSEGVRRGEIVDFDAASRAIRVAVGEAEAASGSRIQEALFTLSCGNPRSLTAEAQVRVAGDAIQDTDMARLLSSCHTPVAVRVREALHAAPVNFIVDGKDGVRDPRGLKAESVGVEMRIITADRGPIRTIVDCAQRCGLAVAGVAVTPHASGLACLVEDELALGAAVVDFGAGTTSIATFRRGQLVFADVAPVGGGHMTQDIASGLDLDFDAAERIKTGQAAILGESSGESDVIQLGEGREVARSVLTGVMRPRLEETLELVAESLAQGGFHPREERQVVLTGGASQLPGLVESAQRVLGRRVRLGRPLRVAGLPDSTAGPDFSAAAGLFAFAARSEREVWSGAVLDAIEPRTRLEKYADWVKRNW